MSEETGTKTWPSATEVASRCFILKLIAAYALSVPPRDALQELSATWSSRDRSKFETEDSKFRERLWAEIELLQSHLSPTERTFAEATALTMSTAQQINASWRVEAFQVMLWALNLQKELPPYDVGAEHERLKAYPPKRFEKYLKSAALRPMQEIETARDLAELWHWRSRTRQLQEECRSIPDSLRENAEAASYSRIIRGAAAVLHERFGGTVLGEDFSAFGKPYRDLDQDEWSEIRSITMERHFALNWLCGYAPGNAWDDTPTDT